MKLEGQPYDVFEDSRGRIMKYDINGSRFNVLFTKKGALRSGDFHPAAQFDLVLSGTIEIIQRLGKKSVSRKIKANEMIAIPKDVPHLFKSVTDSVVVEWWDGPFKAQYYKPYRDIVDKQLKK